jgi:hypothetical protein
LDSNLHMDAEALSQSSDKSRKTLVPLGQLPGTLCDAGVSAPFLSYLGADGPLTREMIIEAFAGGSLVSSVPQRILADTPP